MARTTVNIDYDALAAASEELGTEGLTVTVNAALRQVARRHALAAFDVRRDIDGSPSEVEAARRERDSELKRF